ncbi:hypothetical protein KCMC57_63770 (plasmid) [Kitasatospora sp. CMC57]|uniref:Helix-turn-helix domain-containing protein n=1 Tax=Kitasatospora sp. CMC57 TaxID=3231513 RepID=A0AB33K8L0_9ACTN
MATPILLAPSDIAALLNRPVGTIWRWAHEGRLTSYDGKYDWTQVTEVASGARKTPPKPQASVGS